MLVQIKKFILNSNNFWKVGHASFMWESHKSKSFIRFLGKGLAP